MSAGGTALRSSGSVGVTFLGGTYRWFATFGLKVTRLQTKRLLDQHQRGAVGLVLITPLDQADRRWTHACRDGKIDLREPELLALGSDFFSDHARHGTRQGVTSQATRQKLPIAPHGTTSETTSVPDVFGAMMRSARDSRKWSQKQLAAQIDDACDDQQISKWERGVNRPGSVRARRIIELLALPAEEAWDAWSVKPAKPFLPPSTRDAASLPDVTADIDSLEDDRPRKRTGGRRRSHQKDEPPTPS